MKFSRLGKRAVRFFPYYAGVRVNSSNLAVEPLSGIDDPQTASRYIGIVIRSQELPENIEVDGKKISSNNLCRIRLKENLLKHYDFADEKAVDRLLNLPSVVPLAFFSRILRQRKRQKEAQKIK